MIKGYGLTDIGKVRERNEDLFLLKLPYLAAVADGMGGYHGGLEASQIAIQTIEENLVEFTNHPGTEIKEWMISVVEKANREIFLRSKEDQSLSGMGTTLSVAYFANQILYWAHVGDCRIYLIRDDHGKLITKDHTLSPQNGNKSHVLTRALGVQDQILIDTGEISLSTGDMIFLCSDGLYDLIEEKEMLEILQEETPIEKLIERANLAGGKDNITGVLLSIES